MEDRKNKSRPNGGGGKTTKLAPITARAKARDDRYIRSGYLWWNTRGHHSVISNADEIADTETACIPKMDNHPL
jgi:hypothetical protein